MHFSMHHTYQYHTQKPLLKIFLFNNHCMAFYSPPQHHSSTHAIPLAPNLHKFFNKLMCFFVPKTTQRNRKQTHNNPIQSYVYHCFVLLEASVKEKTTIILKTHFLFLEVNVANFNIKHFTPQLDGTSSFHGDFSFHTILTCKMIGKIDIRVLSRLSNLVLHILNHEFEVLLKMELEPNSTIIMVRF